MSRWNVGSFWWKLVAFENRIQSRHSDATPLPITIAKKTETTKRMRPA